VAIADGFMDSSGPPNSALPATRTRWPRRETATLYFSSITAERGPTVAASNTAAGP
jgi:hypothetical protein